MNKIEKLKKYLNDAQNFIQLTYIDLSGFNTSNVTTMYRMFD